MHPRPARAGLNERLVPRASSSHALHEASAARVASPNLLGALPMEIGNTGFDRNLIAGILESADIEITRTPWDGFHFQNRALLLDLEAFGDNSLVV